MMTEQYESSSESKDHKAYTPRTLNPKVSHPLTLETPENNMVCF